jgi:UDP-glucose 4-epimerase
VQALVLAAEYDAGPDEPRVFNIGHGSGHSLNEIIREIKNVVDMPVQVNYTPARSVDVPVNVLDISRATRYLEWHPQTDLATGLAATWKWVKQLKNISSPTPR